MSFGLGEEAAYSTENSFQADNIYVGAELVS